MKLSVIWFSKIHIKHKILLPTNGDIIDAVVTFGNGAMLEGRYFGYSCSGTLHFIFGEDVNFTEDGLIADIGKSAIEPNPLCLDLPVGMDDRIDFSMYLVSFTDSTGWHHEGFSIYATASWPFENPSLRMTAVCGSCLANLHD